MRRSFYTNSTRAWEAMLRAIQGARTSVYLEMYIFLESEQDHDFVSALIDRAHAGARVVVILDVVGSYGLAAAVRDRLIAAGVELMYYRYLLHRTHRKMLIVDERVAFLGGVNVGARFAQWDDLVVRVRGPVVPHVVRSFARAYVLCGGSQPALVERTKHELLERTKLWFVEHGLGGTRYVLRRMYEEAIEAAHTRVVLVTPYFVPGRWLVAALARAQKRGVAVHILLPTQTDVPLVDRVSRYYADELLQLGTSVYLYPTMLHAKAILVDDHRAMVGSHNLDSLSFGRNVEAGLMFETASLVSELRGILDTWFSQAALLQGPSKARWYDRLVVALIRLGAPVL